MRLALIHDFDSDKELEITRNLLIRKLSDNERSSLTDRDIIKDALSFRDKIFVVQQEEDDRDKVKLDLELNNLLTSLRLFKRGRIRFPVLLSHIVWDDSDLTRIFSMEAAIAEPLYTYPLKAYSITFRELDSFKRFYQDFVGFDKTDVVIALRRFDSLYERKANEDIIIDTMIAFENLLLPEKLELGLRLGIRTANLVAKGRKRKEVYEFMRKAYDLRSEIVHGEHPKELKTNDSKFSIEQVSVRLEDYLRKATIQFLRLRRKHSKSTTIESLTELF